MERGTLRNWEDEIEVKDQWVVAEHQNNSKYKFKAAGSSEVKKNLWLSSVKMTDSLFFAPHNVNSALRLSEVAPSSDYLGVRAGAISAAYLITYGAAKALDIDPEEIEIIEPRKWNRAHGVSTPLFQFADYLEGGAGYCQALEGRVGQSEPLLISLMRQLTSASDFPFPEILDESHRKQCDYACYECMQRFSNQHYHGLLDWRLGIDYIACLLDPSYSCGLTGHRHPLTDDWESNVMRYLENMRSFDPDNFQMMAENGVYAFKLAANSRKWALVAHPFWDRDEIEANRPDISKLLRRNGHEVEVVSSFDLSRRQVYVWEKLSGRKS